MCKNKYDISNLITKYLLGELNSSESSYLINWLKNKKNKALFERITDKNNILEKIQEYDRDNKDRAWQNIESRINKPSVFISLLKYAAILAGPVLLACLLYFLTPTEQASQTLSQAINPGKPGAALYLTDGSVIQLNNDTSEQVKIGNNLLIEQGDNLISLQNIFTQNTAGKLNKIVTDKGHEYNVVLPDGTRVYMNACSQIEFPSSFSTDKREIKAYGELYFEVHKASSWPFIIKNDNAVLQVTGTAFNFRAYKDEKTTTTTLVEGKVRVQSNSGKTINLSPGYASVISNNTPGHQQQKADLASVTAWKEGQFYYDNQPIKRIMTDLSRWYNVDIFYENASIQNKRFSINLPRYNNIDTFLAVLERTGQVSFSTVDNAVIIK